MPNLQINAADTLFFRDGRPFNMGEDTYAQGIFPPPPSVLYGALRTAYMAANLSGEKLSVLITKTEQLTITGIFLRASDGHTYLPMPKDLYVKKDANAGFFPEKKVSTTSSLPTSLQMLLHNVNGKPDEQARLVRLEEFQKYLAQGKTAEKITSIPLKDFTEKEPKIGIRRNNQTHANDEGLLYRMEMVRPAKVRDGELYQLSFLVDYQGLDLPAETWLRMGGDRKAVQLTKFEEPTQIGCPELKSSEFKIYLATPAVFESGWKPRKLLDDNNLELLAAATGKPMPLGGWDVKEKKPKCMLRAVPAGSVYYVKAESKEKAQATAEKIHNHTISEYDLAQQGFGLAFIGNI